MGRGRAKAKQTKVARELKYSAPSMDLSRLQRDLHSDDPFLGQSRDGEPSADHADDGDQYASYPDDDEEDPASSAAS